MPFAETDKAHNCMFSIQLRALMVPHAYAANYKTSLSGALLGLVELDRTVQRAHRQLEILFRHHHGNLDLRGADHLDVDALRRQRLEHLAGDTGVRTHADADQGYLGDLVVTGDLACAKIRRSFLENLLRLGEVVAVHGEGEVGGALGTDVLHDHVDLDIGIANRAKDLVGNAGGVRCIADGQLGFIAGEGDPGNYRLFHINLIINRNQGPRTLLETGQNAQRHIVLAGEFHRTNLQHLGTEAGHFQHFLEGDGVEATGLVDHARVGGIDTVDIGVDLALIGLQRRRQRHGGGIGAATTKGGDIAVGVNALETGHHDHTTGIQVLAHLVLVDLLDTRLHVRVVSEDRDLGAGVGTRLKPLLVQCHRQQRNGDLLAGGHQHIPHARRRLLGDLFGEADQAIGFTAHGGHHHHDLVTLLLEFGDLGGNRFDTLHG